MPLATFAAGCFWGSEKFFKKNFGPHLKSIAVGYLGGKTGHAEVVQMEYTEGVQYADLVRFFFRFHDPTTPNRQGNDRGTQYRSAIFYHNPEQKEIAERIKEEVGPKWEELRHAKVVTEIAEASTFYKAEPYHQQYLDNNPGGYCNHRTYW